MGMAIFGKRPDARSAESALYPTAHWTALIACVRELAPMEASVCNDWMGNGFVDAESSMALAARLDLAVSEGAVESYIKERNSFLVEHPSMPCVHCRGTGSFGSWYCNRCHGNGALSTHDWYRDLYVSDVLEFIEFVRHSGGFEISDIYFGVSGKFQIVDFGLLQDEKGKVLG
jgi:hypothetical protein